MNTSSPEKTRSFRDAINAQLRAEIAAQGLTPGKISDTLGYARASLQRWLRGEREMPVSVLVEISLHLGMLPHLVVKRAEDRVRDTATGVTP